MLKNLSFIALLGIAAVGVPSELSAKIVKVAGTQKGAAAKSITRQVAQQNVTIEFYSPSIVRILKSDAGLWCSCAEEKLFCHLETSADEGRSNTGKRRYCKNQF